MHIRAIHWNYSYLPVSLQWTQSVPHAVYGDGDGSSFYPEHITMRRVIFLSRTYHDAKPHRLQLYFLWCIWLQSSYGYCGSGCIYSNTITCFQQGTSRWHMQSVNTHWFMLIFRSGILYGRMCIKDHCFVNPYIPFLLHEIFQVSIIYLIYI